MDKKTIVTGVIGADVHAVGNKILTYALEQAGFNVVNLGVMVAQEEYIEAAIETKADAILVSSLYGHGEIDCNGLPRNATRQVSKIFLCLQAATWLWANKTSKT